MAVNIDKAWHHHQVTAGNLGICRPVVAGSDMADLVAAKGDVHVPKIIMPVRGFIPGDDPRCIPNDRGILHCGLFPCVWFHARFFEKLAFASIGLLEAP